MLKIFKFKMLTLRGLKNLLNRAQVVPPIQAIQCAGLKSFTPPIRYDNVEMPERSRLRVLEKVPQYQANLRPPKMTKRLMLMRGPEKVHDFLVHEQYGIMATQGGRLKAEHFEMIRMSILRRIDEKRMFAIWRVPAPWQPITKKGKGMGMGGGKSSIDHYATPVRTNRIIIELAGLIEYAEAVDTLKMIADRLPFNAIPVSQQLLDKNKAQKEAAQKNNLNPYTMKYAIQNNLTGCHTWLRPTDHFWFGEYL